MRKLLMLLIVFAVFSCQKEELTITQDESESSFLADRQLTGMVKSVASHDGSFDDIIDRSPCFSINFPYQILLNGYLYEVNSVNDLLPITKHDFVVPIFPLNITFANYLETEVATQEAFNSVIEDCQTGLLYNDRITCVDFNYPVKVAIYNSATSDFETMTFNHDKETFTEIELMTQNTLASINYPITLMLEYGDSRVINSNEELKQLIMSVIPDCE